MPTAPEPDSAASSRDRLGRMGRCESVGPLMLAGSIVVGVAGATDAIGAFDAVVVAGASGSALTTPDGGASRAEATSLRMLISIRLGQRPVDEFERALHLLFALA